MDKIIRPKTLAKKLSISIPTLYRTIKTPGFPPKIKIGKRAVGWLESDIEDWLQSRRSNDYMENE